jgi:hypothetical protein
MKKTIFKLIKIEHKLRKQGKEISANQIMVARETIEDFYLNKRK